MSSDPRLDLLRQGVQIEGKKGRQKVTMEMTLPVTIDFDAAVTKWSNDTLVRMIEYLEDKLNERGLKR